MTDPASSASGRERRRWVAEVPAERLDRFVTAALGDPAISRTAVQRAIRAGLVRMDGRAAAPADPVPAGAVIEWDGLPSPPHPRLAPEDIPLEVVYEDEHLLVINKPRGLVVHPAPGHWEHTLVQALLARYGTLEPETAQGTDRGPQASSAGLRPGIVHRLDKDTTGLLVVARSERAAAVLRRQLAARGVTREYLGIVRGTPPPSFVIDAPIGRARTEQRMAVVEGGRPARTHAQRQEIFPGTPTYALLRLRLETGRTHQIRVHLASAGMPIAGDPLYGDPGADRRAGLMLAGQALHAWRLRLQHPVNGEWLQWEVEPPADFQAALQTLRRRSPSPPPSA